MVIIIFALIELIVTGMLAVIPLGFCVLLDAGCGAAHPQTLDQVSILCCESLLLLGWAIGILRFIVRMCQINIHISSQT